MTNPWNNITGLDFISIKYMNFKITSFRNAEKAIRFIRDAVFGEEQQIPRDLEWDNYDQECIHIVAFDLKMNPIGTGRLQPDGKIGRLSVLSRYRGQGIGGRMLDLLIEAACDKGIEEVYLHAQVQAISFYERKDFKKDGIEFTEAGIPHIKMKRNTQQHRKSTHTTHIAKEQTAPLISQKER